MNTQAKLPRTSGSRREHLCLLLGSWSEGVRVEQGQTWPHRAAGSWVLVRTAVRGILSRGPLSTGSTRTS